MYIAGATECTQTFLQEGGEHNRQVQIYQLHISIEAVNAYLMCVGWSTYTLWKIYIPMHTTRHASTNAFISGTRLRHYTCGRCTWCVYAELAHLWL